MGLLGRIYGPAGGGVPSSLPAGDDACTGRVLATASKHARGRLPQTRTQAHVPPHARAPAQRAPEVEHGLGGRLDVDGGPLRRRDDALHLEGARVLEARQLLLKHGLRIYMAPYVDACAFVCCVCVCAGCLSSSVLPWGLGCTTLRLKTRSSLQETIANAPWCAHVQRVVGQGRLRRLRHARAGVQPCRRSPCPRGGPCAGRELAYGASAG